MTVMSSIEMFLDSVESVQRRAIQSSPSTTPLSFPLPPFDDKELMLPYRQPDDVSRWFQQNTDPRDHTLRSVDRGADLIAELDRQRDRITLDRNTHRYTVDGVTVPLSVTSCLDRLCGTFDAESAAERMLKNKRKWRTNKLYASCNFDEQGKELTQDAIVDRIKESWLDVAARGTRMHEFIDSWYRGKDSSSSVSVSNANLAAFRHWETIRVRNMWLLLATEFPVYSPEWGLAGTVDAIFVPDASQPRQVVLVDWKRADVKTASFSFYENPFVSRYARSNYWKYAMQLNLYREILERWYDLKVIEMMIVAFGEHSTRCETIGVPRMHELRPFLDTLKS